MPTHILINDVSDALTGLSSAGDGSILTQGSLALSLGFVLSRFQRSYSDEDMRNRSGLKGRKNKARGVSPGWAIDG